MVVCAVLLFNPVALIINGAKTLFSGNAVAVPVIEIIPVPVYKLGCKPIILLETKASPLGNDPINSHPLIPVVYGHGNPLSGEIILISPENGKQLGNNELL